MSQVDDSNVEEIMNFNNNAAITFIQTCDSKISGMRNIACNLKDPKEYQMVIQRVKELVKRSYPFATVQVLPYGSRIIGIGTSSSDLDLYVEVDGTNSEKLFKLLVRLFRNSSDWRVSGVVEKTPVPVISAVSTFNNLNCKCKLNFRLIKLIKFDSFRRHYNEERFGRCKLRNAGASVQSAASSSSAVSFGSGLDKSSRADGAQRLHDLLVGLVLLAEDQHDADDRGRSTRAVAKND